MKRILHLIKHAKKRTLILVGSVALVLALAIGTSFALLITRTNSVDNTFVPPTSTISLEGYDDIKNTGNIPVYIRAYALANWYSTDDEHTILSEKPQANVDYSIHTIGENWFLASDGFYYYTKVLEPNESVALFTSATQIKQKTGYELRIQILASSIQIDPVDAIQDAWPAVRVNENGELEPATTP